MWNNRVEEQIKEFKTRSDKEVLDYLSNYWKITPNEEGVFTMVGTYKKADHRDKKGNEFAYFEDLRNTDGDILYYPFGKYGKVKLWTACNDKLEKQEIWRISVKLAPKKYREKNPFALTIASSIFGLPSTNLRDKLSREAQIRNIFKNTGFTDIDAENTVSALHNIMDDLYSNADDRFVYELLQNADDQPEDGQQVSVILQLLKEHLLFMHNGRVFDRDDVNSICRIGRSTKRKDKEKIGYKGIGFKSVFTGSDTVIINSGNYSFAFDKFSPVYGDANMENIPWQLKPIWQEKYRYPKEVKENDTFWKERVGISLEVEESKIQEYRMSIAKIFRDPIFLLFLKNVCKLEFIEGGLRTFISKKKDGNVLRIERDGEVDSSWLIKDYVISIPEEIREALQDDRNVPEKLKKSTLTQISFAAKVEDGKISKTDNSVLYAYLPTSVKDFGFNFIVNADFLLAANREQLHVKKIWNQFLFGEIGKLSVDWVASLSKIIPSYLELLPGDKLNEEESGTLSLSPFFNKSYIEALENTSLILSDDGVPVKQDEIIIDKSGLSDIIGTDLFLELIESKKILPSSGINTTVFGSKIFDGIEKVSSDNVLTKMQRNQIITSWYQSTNEDNRHKFYDWLKSKDTEARRQNIKLLVEKFPIYKFGESYLYKSQIEADPNKFVIRSPHKVLKPIFEVCGYDCSDDIDELPLAQFYSENVVKSTFPYIFGHLYQRESFFKWLSESSNEDMKVLIDWLLFQDKNNHKAVSDFVESLPIVKFDDVSMTKQSASTDSARIIIISKIESAKPILMKMGFLCSHNIEKSPFIDLISPPKEIDLFNRIKEKTATALLTPKEKIELFKTLKLLTGVTDTLLSQIILFANNSNTYRKCLSVMTAYSTDSPVWIYNYSINELENFEELQPYLIKKERIFVDVIKPNIEEISKEATFKEVYSTYKDSWTLEFTKIIINKYGVTLPVLDMVEVQDSDSQKYLLQKVDKIELNLDEVITNNSYKFRVLTLALKVLSDEGLRSFAGKIWIGERSLSSFMVSDEVSITYHEGKILRIPLNKLLPSYTDTGTVLKIKNILSEFDENSLCRLLQLKPMGAQEVWQKINSKNEYSPYSYLLGIYCTRKIHGWYANWVTYVDLSEKDDLWVSELLTIMYNQNVELFDDCFGYRLSSYFTGYLSNDYVNSNETILKSIEKWAETNERVSYIVKLGVKTERTNLVKCRKALINNEPLNSSDIDIIKDNLTSTINLLKSKSLLPFEGNNQVAAMLALATYSKYLVICIDKEMLAANSKEYSLQDYLNWKNNNSISIYIYDGLMPYQLRKSNDDNLLICSFEKENSYYDISTKTLYVNKSCEVRDILYSLVTNSSVPFTAEDWQQLYYDNLVSKSEVESRDQEIEELKNELEEYKKLYGNLPPKPEETKKEENHKDSKGSEDKTNKKDSDPNDKETKKEEDPTIKKGKEQGIPKSEQIIAQIEAQEYLMKAMPEWRFPPHYGEYNEKEGKPYHFSIVKIHDVLDEPKLIVLKSYKKQDEPFKLNPEELDYIFKNSAELLIYTEDDIKRIDKEDLVRNQSSISLSFSTENLDIEERIDAFCSTLHYFKELHFDFNSFNIAENAESIKNIFKKNDGTQSKNTEGDL